MSGDGFKNRNNCHSCFETKADAVNCKQNLIEHAEHYKCNNDGQTKINIATVLFFFIFDRRSKEKLIREKAICLIQHEQDTKEQKLALKSSKLDY